LGCTVRTGTEVTGLDVTVQTEPVVQVTHERLWAARRRGRSGPTEERDLLVTDAPRPDSSDIVARWDSQKRGTNPPLTFRASRLLTAQVLSRVPATAAGRVVHEAAGRVLAALRSVFVLDPIPHQMRQ